MMGRIAGGLLFICLGAGIGGLFFFMGLYMTGSTSMTCQRVESNQANCTITEHHWLGFADETTSLNHVQKARSESYSCTTGTGKKKRTTTCHKLVIQTQSGDVQPSNFLGTDLVDDLNQFLASTQPTWTYETGISYWIFGICFAVLGAVVGPIFVVAGFSMLFGTVTQTSGMDS